MQRGEFALVERAAEVREMALEARANGRGLVRFGEDCFESGVDVAIRNAASAEFAGDAKTSLATRIGVLASVVKGVAGVVEVALFAEAGDYAVDVIFAVRTTCKILAHFVNRVRAAHEGAKGSGVKLLLGRKLARRGMGTHAKSITGLRTGGRNTKVYVRDTKC